MNQKNETLFGGFSETAYKNAAYFNSSRYYGMKGQDMPLFHVTICADGLNYAVTHTGSKAELEALREQFADLFIFDKEVLPAGGACFGHGLEVSDIAFKNTMSLLPK